jgi:methyl-accepting chemotaxis protein
VANLGAIDAATAEKRKLVERLKADGAAGDRSVAGIAEIASEVAQSTALIMSLVGVIGDISERTSLLAMNAAIEAAHAGHSGRGFAVVADEIRKLAESTDRNSKDISKSLGGIVDKIGRSAALSASAKAALGTILEGIEAVDGSLGETQSGLTEISAGGGQILSAVAELTALTSAIRDAGNEIGEQTRLIEGAADQAAALSAENERCVAEISGGLGEIVQAATDLSSLGIRNAENIAILDGEMGRFKTD